MFIIKLTYKVPLEVIDKHLNNHIEYLNIQYEQKNFLISGGKVPRIGGIIISSMNDKSELLKVIEKDPFKVHNLATYEVIEFKPSKASKEFNFLLK